MRMGPHPHALLLRDSQTRSSQRPQARSMRMGPHTFKARGDPHPHSLALCDWQPARLPR
jgi:hypothetical protein